MLRPDNVFLAVKPVDMRRGIDTLTQYIQDELKSTWHEGAAFVFNLPRVEKIIRPDTDHCPECDEPLHHIRDAVSEKLEYIPAHFVVNRYIRPQYSCPCCQKVFSGEMPAHILPKSAVEPSVIAQVVINKHCDHQPLYRQRPIFARSDVDLPASSMADMVGAAGAALSPLAALLHRELMSRPVVHADETTLKILDTKKGGKSCTGYLWAYVSGERTGPSVVCFDCRPAYFHERRSPNNGVFQGSCRLM